MFLLLFYSLEDSPFSSHSQALGWEPLQVHTLFMAFLQSILLASYRSIAQLALEGVRILRVYSLVSHVLLTVGSWEPSDGSLVK